MAELTRTSTEHFTCCCRQSDHINRDKKVTSAIEVRKKIAKRERTASAQENLLKKYK